MGAIYERATDVVVWLGETGQQSPGLDAMSDQDAHALIAQGERGWWRRLWYVTDSALVVRYLLTA
jgi:hypothetical protein